MSDSVDSDGRFARRAGCTACELDGETVVMSVRQGAYYTLDEVATRVWQLLAEPQTLDELVARLTTEYDVAADACRGDVHELLTDLRHEGLVEVIARAATP